jgi:monoamine oxidase
MDCDVVIIGAGVAGLAAAAKLVGAGKRVQCLEATGRVGGRIRTVHDPLAPVPIELGAEFVHGRSAESWNVIESAGLAAYEHTAQALHIDRGRVLKEKEVGEVADHVMEQMAKSKRKDESFEDFLGRSRQSPEIKNWARLYVEGFNAARNERISTASLRRDAEAAEEIDGDRSFRILNGYDSLVLYLLRLIPDHLRVVQLNAIVERVKWRAGRVSVQYRSALDNQTRSLQCARLIVTVPLGVLQASADGPGAIAFDPEPTKILKAARALDFGQVYRVTFRFRHAFWDEDEKLKGVGFLLSREKLFPTWWTTHPVIAPVLTGWTAGSAADPLRGASQATIVEEALRSLERILNREIPQPEAVYFHNWEADPFFRGSYSYVPVDAMPAREALSRPVKGTLFFAGEATDTTGNGSMVHGAIASGVRAALQVLGG